MKTLYALVLLCQFAWANVPTEQLITQYQTIHEAMASNNVEIAAEQAKAFLEVVAPWLEENAEDPAKEQMVAAQTGATELALANTQAMASLTFGHLSRGVVEFIRSKSPLHSQWQLFYCPMYEQSGADYGHWVQPMGIKIANPYFGAAMLTCGSKKKWA